MRGAAENAALAQVSAASRAKYGPATTIEERGGLQVVTESPASLASRASVPIEVYSLARMIESEEGSGSPETLIALGEAARNYARSIGKTITSLLTDSSRAESRGLYSEQRGKWASTRLDPTQRSIVAAMSVLGTPETNLVDGASDFFDPKTQEGGVQAGKPLSLSAAEYILRNAQKGFEWIGSYLGIDPYRLMLFRKITSRNVDTDGALAVVAAKKDVGWTPRAIGIGLTTIAAIAIGTYLIVKG